MKKTRLQIELSMEDLNCIKSFYGASDTKTVESVVKNILERYLNVEYFDPELVIEPDG